MLSCPEQGGVHNIRPAAYYLPEQVQIICAELRSTTIKILRFSAHAQILRILFVVP